MATLMRQFRDAFDSMMGLYVSSDPTLIDEQIYDRTYDSIFDELSIGAKGTLNLVETYLTTAKEEPTLWRLKFPASSYEGLISVQYKIHRSLLLMLRAFKEEINDIRKNPADWVGEIERNNQGVGHRLLVADEQVMTALDIVRKTLRASFDVLTDILESNQVCWQVAARVVSRACTFVSHSGGMSSSCAYD